MQNCCTYLHALRFVSETPTICTSQHPFQSDKSLSGLQHLDLHDAHFAVLRRAK